MTTVTTYLCQTCGRETERLYDGDVCAICRHYHLSASQETSCTAMHMIEHLIEAAIIYEGVNIDDMRKHVNSVLSSPSLEERRPRGRDPLGQINRDLEAHQALLRAEVA